MRLSRKRKKRLRKLYSYFLPPHMSKAEWRCRWEWWQSYLRLWSPSNMVDGASKLSF